MLSFGVIQLIDASRAYWRKMALPEFKNIENMLKHLINVLLIVLL